MSSSDTTSETALRSVAEAARASQLYSSIGVVAVAAIVASTVGFLTRSPLLVAMSIGFVIALAFFVRAGDEAFRSLSSGKKSPYLYFQHALLAVLICAFVVAMLLGIAYSWQSLILTIPPESYPFRAIEFDHIPLAQALPQQTIPNRDERVNQQFRDTMASFWDWLYKGASPVVQNALEVKSSEGKSITDQKTRLKEERLIISDSRMSAFDEAIEYLPFNGRLRVPGCTIIDGAALLVTPQQGVTISESERIDRLPFRVFDEERGEDGVILSSKNELHVLRAGRGKLLRVILKVLTDKGDDRSDYVVEMVVDRN